MLAGVQGVAWLAVGMSLVYALTIGFHDAANSIATLVATGQASPGRAVVLATVGNLLGPLVLGTAVAETVAGIVTVPPGSLVPIVGAALTGAVLWNLYTWRRGLPSSSGHALVGGLVGVAVIAEGRSAVEWGGFEGLRPVGVVGVLVGLALSPLLGFALALGAERAVRRSLARATRRINGPIRLGSVASSVALAASHGANDAQKAVGIIAAVLLAEGQTSSLTVPPWAILSSAVALTIGTALGGWSIVRTIGERIYRLRPVDSFSIQASSAAVIIGASVVGAPVSTTHVVASSVVGVGAGRRRWRHVHLPIVRAILMTWLTTIPAAAGLGVLAYPIWRWLS